MKERFINEKFVKKTDLPFSFKIAFRLMIFFGVLYFLSLVIISAVSPNYINEKVYQILQILPFVFIILGVISLMFVALIIVITYLKMR